MSSLGAVQADGYYHPPDWDPQKKSRQKFQKSKGASAYERTGIVRFEMPFSVWCGGCGRHIGKGTRFNTTKHDVGFYFSTKLLSFRMQCASCPQLFDVRTDPKNTRYVCHSGLRERVREFDDADAEVERLDGDELRFRKGADPMFKLEAEQGQSAALKASKVRSSALGEMGDARRDDDFAANQHLRQRHRKQRKSEARGRARQAASATPHIRLLPTSDADRAAARAAFAERPAPKKRAGPRGSIFKGAAARKR